MSCEKDNSRIDNDLTSESDSNLNLIEKNYINFLITKKEIGSTLIQSNTNFLTQKSNKNIGYSRVLGKSKKDNLIKIEGLSKNIFADKSKSNLSNELYNLFGTEISYSFGETSKNNHSFYIPEFLEVSFSTEKISEGTIIEWNIDEKNPNGVVIYANYNPASQPNVQLAFDNPNRVKEVAFIEDMQGSYTITKEDIERFPVNSFVSIDVLRGGFVVIEDEPVLGAITKVNSDMQIAD
jgi:hypothetical protein